MTEQKHIIWSSDPDYEDWRDDLEEQYPELSEQERMELMVEQNNDYLDDERCNLNIQLSRPILLIADIGRWDGRYPGYAEIIHTDILEYSRKTVSGRNRTYADGFAVFRLFRHYLAVLDNHVFYLDSVKLAQLYGILQSLARRVCMHMHLHKLRVAHHNQRISDLAQHIAQLINILLCYKII